MKWHPHIHVLIADRYLNNKGELKKYDYFHFDFLRIAFRNALFNHIYTFFKENRPKDEQRKMFLLLKELKEIYPLGYYVYGKKFSNEKTTTKDIIELTNYLARYASHPPISERRIVNFDTINNSVTWFYDPHEDDDVGDGDMKIGRQYITEDVFSFMSRLIMYIPNKGFQQIRYYGFYSNKFKNKIENNKLFSNYELNKMLRATIWVNGLKFAFGYDPTICKCGTQILINFELSYFNRKEDFG